MPRNHAASEWVNTTARAPCETMRTALLIIAQASHTTRQPTMNPDHLQLLVTREMTFGKYKGRLIADLPGHYLGWFAREGFPKGEIGQLIALMYELDHNNLRHLLDPLRRR